MAKGILPPPGDTNNNQSDDEHSSLSSRARHTLSPLAIPLFNPSSVEEVREGGEFLFRQYVIEELEHEIPPEPPLLNIHPEAASGGDNQNINNFNAISSHGDLIIESLRHRGTVPNFTNESTPEGYKNNEWTRYGRELREIANAFALSEQGAEVRRTAEETILAEINEQRFWNLLTELFADGFSRERLIALFYYCAMLIIRTRRIGNTTLTGQLFTWSLTYIRDTVCNWVHEHGGWGRVLRDLWHIFQTIGITCFVVLGIASAFVYIRKNW